jgi:two-component sensor histidine kinase
MRTAECIGGVQPGATKTQDGKLWFPTINGVVVVDPKRLQKNPHKPPVHIEAVIADRKDYTDVENLSLSPGKEKFEFHYTATSLSIPERVRFKYRLEGFDKDWVDAGTRRVAYYTNIRPGKYRFQVIASNNDDLWNEEGDAFSFYLEPYFYQTPWFYALCAVLTVLVALSGYRYRMKKVKAEFSAVIAERSRIARDLHDTLAQSLTGILLQLDAAEDSQNSRVHVTKAQDLARKSLEEARRTVWALRPQALESSDLVSAITSLVQQTKENTSLDIQFNMSGAKRQLSPKVEQHILRIAQEAITNCVKHAAAKRIQLNLDYQNDKLELFVQDDGHGFDPNTASSDGHFGLTGMKERAGQIGGEIQIESKTGKGTGIKVSIPL